MNNVITVEKKELAILVQENVRKVVLPAFMKLRALLVPFISDAEQRDIEKRYGKRPTRNVAKTIMIDI